MVSVTELVAECSASVGTAWPAATGGSTAPSPVQYIWITSPAWARADGSGNHKDEALAGAQQVGGEDGGLGRRDGHRLRNRKASQCCTTSGSVTPAGNVYGICALIWPALVKTSGSFTPPKVTIAFCIEFGSGRAPADCVPPASCPPKIEISSPAEGAALGE